MVTSRAALLGRIVLNLIDAAEYPEKYRRWVEGLFHPISHLERGYEKRLLDPSHELLATPNRR